MRTFSVVNNKLMVEDDTHITSYEITNVYLNHKLKVGNEVNPTKTIRLYTVSPDIDVLEMIEIYNEGTFKHFYVVNGSTTAEKNGVTLTPSFIDWYNDIKGKEAITVSVDYSDGKVIFSGPLLECTIEPSVVYYTKKINGKNFTTVFCIPLKEKGIKRDEAALYLTELDTGIVVGTEIDKLKNITPNLTVLSPAFTDWCGELSKQQDVTYSKMHKD